MKLRNVVLVPHQMQPSDYYLELKTSDKHLFFFFLTLRPDESLGSVWNIMLLCKTWRQHDVREQRTSSSLVSLLGWTQTSALFDLMIAPLVNLPVVLKVKSFMTHHLMHHGCLCQSIWDMLRVKWKLTCWLHQSNAQNFKFIVQAEPKRRTRHRPALLPPEATQPATLLWNHAFRVQQICCSMHLVFWMLVLAAWLEYCNGVCYHMEAPVAHGPLTNRSWEAKPHIGRRSSAPAGTSQFQLLCILSGIMRLWSSCSCSHQASWEERTKMRDQYPVQPIALCTSQQWHTYFSNTW